MKRLIAAICIICLFALCGCTPKRVYSPPENIALNYNNVSAHSTMWLTNEGYCYLEYGLFNRAYYYATRSGVQRLCNNNGYPLGRAQQYDSDTIYIMEEHHEADDGKWISLFKSYDLKNRKVTKITNMENCLSYFLLDGAVFYLQYKECVFALNPALMMYSGNTHTTVAPSVLAFGVRNNQLVYLTVENGTATVYQYDKEVGLANAIASFSVGTLDVDDLLDVKVCFTSDRVLLVQTNATTYTSTIWNYSFDADQVHKETISGWMYDFVSYDKNSFFTLLEKDDTDNVQIIQMDNATNTRTCIGQHTGYCSLFVGSDAGAYVSGGGIAYYSETTGRVVVY